jgi:DNA-binding Xre family transcriptional regulator
MAVTKLAKLLILKGMTQQELHELVLNRTGHNIQLYRISTMVNGHLRNFKVATARALATALDVSTDDIIEDSFED